MFAFDLNQERPSFEESRRIWDSEVFVAVDTRQPLPDELILELRKIYSNGGAEFARFLISNDSRLDWFVSRNRLDEIDFFRHFLTSSALRATFPRLQVSDSIESLKWEWTNPYQLDGEFAQVLKSGGAYLAFEGSGEEAKRTGARACELLYQHRYDDILLSKSHTPWSEWFYNIAWDTTWIGIDKGTRTVWILCITDTD